MKQRLHKMLLHASCVLLIAVFQLLPGHLQAQSDKKVVGTITSALNAPVVGATVMVKQTKKTAVTDAAGKFSIEAQQGQTLMISSVGYEAKQVTVGNQNNLNLSLEVNASTLSDVVVIGYGTQKRKDLTGSISSVNINETKKYSASDISQLLQGRATGVAVNSDGQPGAVPSVRIRGFSTFGGSQPYYVVDGVPGSAIRDFSPNDIETMTVLKDASAAAIYGAAAANGVIIITTTSLKVEAFTSRDRLRLF